MDAEVDFSPQRTEDCAGDIGVGREENGFRGVVVVNEVLLLDFFVFFDECAVASWNEELDKGPEKPPRPDLFLAVHSCDVVGINCGISHC